MFSYGSMQMSDAEKPKYVYCMYMQHNARDQLESIANVRIFWFYVGK